MILFANINLVDFWPFAKALKQIGFFTVGY